MRNFRRTVLSAHLAALLLLPATSGPSQTLPDLGDVSQSVISPAQERKLGEATMRQVHGSGAYLDDPDRIPTSSSSRSPIPPSTPSRCRAGTSACTAG